MEVVASLSQGRTAAAQCGLFTHKSVPVIFEPPCTLKTFSRYFYNFILVKVKKRVLVCPFVFVTFLLCGAAPHRGPWRPNS